MSTDSPAPGRINFALFSAASHLPEAPSQRSALAGYTALLSLLRPSLNPSPPRPQRRELARLTPCIHIEKPGISQASTALTVARRMVSRARRRFLNTCSFMHSSRSRPMKLAAKAVRNGLLGAAQCRSIAQASAQARMARDVNSAPLSLTTMYGRPRCSIIAVNPRDARSPVLSGVQREAVALGSGSCEPQTTKVIGG